VTADQEVQAADKNIDISSTSDVRRQIETPFQGGKKDQRGFESSRVRFGACIGSPSFSSCGSGASTCRLFAHASSTLGGVFASERATLALARG